MTPVDVLPTAETLRQVAPGDSGAVSKEDGIDEEAVVAGGGAAGALTSWQEGLDGGSLVVGQSVSASGHERERLEREMRSPRTAPAAPSTLK